MRHTDNPLHIEHSRKLGENIRAARVRKDLPDGKIGQGLDPKSIKSIENAERSPRLLTLVKISGELAVELESLFEGIGPEEDGLEPPEPADGPLGPLERFGANLKWARTQAGLTQEELALQAGVDRAAIGEFERGSVNLEALTLFKLAHALKLPPRVLLRGVRK
ncbi:MAG TPA: helix-turn-helix transcriptional regulator [Solirubrobacteraceae bacterium]|jgi:transcriptional regulator with XRE-family HTH domain|nr:helix-turn-helix transcriptional regulator [Solirubrobacteraceae bacterium]